MPAQGNTFPPKFSQDILYPAELDLDEIDFHKLHLILSRHSPLYAVYYLQEYYTKAFKTSKGYTDENISYFKDLLHYIKNNLMSKKRQESEN